MANNKQPDWGRCGHRPLQIYNLKITRRDSPCGCPLKYFKFQRNAGDGVPYEKLLFFYRFGVSSKRREQAPALPLRCCFCGTIKIGQSRSSHYSFLQSHIKSRGQLPLSCEAALFRLNYYFERMELGSRNAEALFCRAAKLKFYSCYVYIIH